MEKSFKKLGGPQKEAPEDLKNNVISDVSAFKLFSDLFDLFFKDFGILAESIFKKDKK